MTFISSCDNDDDNNISVVPRPTGNKIVYDLAPVSNPQIVGTATVIELDDNSLTVELNLNNTVTGVIHPAYIHFNTAVEGGNPAITLGTVDGAIGSSTINFSHQDNGSPITYQQFLDFNGHINVNQIAKGLETISAQVDIGQNALSGESVDYNLFAINDQRIIGTATLEERLNGTSLVTLMLEGSPAGGEHPAFFLENDAATGGDFIYSLNPVDGNTGMSKTQVATLDGETPISYTELLTFNGHINVHLSAAQLNVIVAQGDFGSNSDPIQILNYYHIYNDIAYIFTQDGWEYVSNPPITLKRGGTYKFEVDTQRHPLWIKSIQGVGTVNAFTAGVRNNGAFKGIITFTVPTTAPNTLYYNCEFHETETNVFTIID